ncbi:MAG TPA: hypothetical protein VHF88_07690 [Thermoleophilaceae bacterium]|nr:hypothetical protein [Thermoleophilaceae bacterium]
MAGALVQHKGIVQPGSSVARRAVLVLVVPVALPLVARRAALRAAATTTVPDLATGKVHPAAEQR